MLHNYVQDKATSYGSRFLNEGIHTANKDFIMEKERNAIEDIANKGKSCKKYKESFKYVISYLTDIRDVLK